MSDWLIESNGPAVPGKPYCDACDNVLEACVCRSAAPKPAAKPDHGTKPPVSNTCDDCGADVGACGCKNVAMAADIDPADLEALNQAATELLQAGGPHAGANEIDTERLNQDFRDAAASRPRLFESPIQPGAETDLPVPAELMKFMGKLF